MPADGCSNMRNLLLLLAAVFVLCILAVFIGAGCFVIGAFIGWVSGLTWVVSLFSAGFLAVIATIGSAMMAIGLAIMAIAGVVAALVALIAFFAVPTYIVMGCTGAQGGAGAVAGFGNFGGAQWPLPIPPFPGLPPLPAGVDPAKFMQCLMAATGAGCSCGDKGKDPAAEAWSLLQPFIAFLEDKAREAKEQQAQLQAYIDMLPGSAEGKAAAEEARKKLDEAKRRGDAMSSTLNTARAAGGQMLSNAGKSLGLG